MASNISIDSVDSDIFFVKQLSNKPSPQRNNSPNILNSTEISETYTTEMPTVSPVASLEPQIETLNDDSNEPTIPYGFRRQLPFVPPSLNDLNLPPNPFNILATMAVVNREHDNNYSPRSPEPPEPSPISTPPMNVSTFNSWETSHTTTDDNTLYSSDESMRIYFPIKPFITAVTSAQDEKKAGDGNVLSKKKGSDAARLRRLRTDDPLKKRNSRSVN